MIIISSICENVFIPLNVYMLKITPNKIIMQVNALIDQSIYLFGLLLCFQVITIPNIMEGIPAVSIAEAIQFCLLTNKITHAGRPNK